MRLRAERRCGELLKELVRATPQTANPGGIKQPTPRGGEWVPSTPYAQALADNSISTQNASSYQRLADVPAQDFEQALAPMGSISRAAGLARVEPRPSDKAKLPPH